VRRSSKIALLVTGLVLLCALGVVAGLVSLSPSLPGIVDCAGPGDPTVGGVVDKPQKVKELFPKLGEVTEAHWQDREAVPRTCPQDIPMRYATTGLVVLPSASTERFLQVYRWQPAGPPELPEALGPYAPPSPRWTSSEAFDAAMGGTFELDAAGNTLFFTTG
jgi:hypothetical protein